MSMSNWRTVVYSASELSEKLQVEQEIRIPSFQRNLVWSDTQKDYFIDSIKKGFPFGAILLYKESESVYQLIDGLQRSNTIKEFINNPSHFFTNADVNEEAIEEISELLGVKGNKAVIQEKITQTLMGWIKTHETMEDIVRIQYRDFSDELANDFPTAKEVGKEIDQIIRPMLDDFISICKHLSEAQIPALVFEGDDSVLPEVFERINSKGTQLSKYQIFAATWSFTKVKIVREKLFDIITHVKSRYETMIEKGYHIDDYDSDELNKNKELDVFNILFGFGKMLTQKYPYLFGKDNNKEKVVGEAFTIINACLGKRYQKINQLHKNLLDTFNNSSKAINDFLIRVLETIHYVDNHLLKGIHKFKGNRRLDSSNSPYHTELQLASIVAATFLLMYGEYKDTEVNLSIHVSSERVTKGEKNPRWPESKKRLKRNLFKIYIMDIIQQRWKGSGDKTLDAIVFKPQKYDREVTWEEFKSAVINWFNYTMYDRNERAKVRNPKEEEKVFLNLLYMTKFTASDQLSEKSFDYEHLATKKKMKQHLEKFDNQRNLPISSIGNLCLLPEYVNRSKQDKTLYEDEEYLQELKKKGLNIHDLQNKYSFVNAEEMNWINKEYDDFGKLKKEYIDFIKLRFERMLHEIRNDFFNNSQD